LTGLEPTQIHRLPNGAGDRDRCSSDPSKVGAGSSALLSADTRPRSATRRRSIVREMRRVQLNSRRNLASSPFVLRMDAETATDCTDQSADARRGRSSDGRPRQHVRTFQMTADCEPGADHRNS